MAVKTTLPKTINQLTPDRSTKKEAKRTGTKALTMPKRIAPVVLEIIRRLRLIGASRSLSKDRFFLSKVMVTASIDVVPNNIEIDITPGSISLIPKSD
jgi:hypothetical protein